MSVWCAWTMKQPSSSTHVAMFFAVTRVQRRSCTIPSCVRCATLELQSLDFAVGPRSIDLNFAPCGSTVLCQFARFTQDKQCAVMHVLCNC